MTSILETAKQVVALDKQVDLKIDLGGEPDEFDGDDIRGLDDLCIQHAGTLAAALVEADGHISNLASMLEAAHRQLGIYSKENKRLVAARAFLSRISKEQDNASS